MMRKETYIAILLTLALCGAIGFLGCDKTPRMCDQCHTYSQAIEGLMNERAQLRANLVHNARRYYQLRDELRRRGLSDVLLTANANAEKTQFAVYIVCDGDSLGSIGSRFNVSADTLKKANPELSTTGLKAGQVVQIPK